MTPLEILDTAVSRGLAAQVRAPDAGPAGRCGKIMDRWPSGSDGNLCFRIGRWEFPGSSFTGRMCTQHGAWFIRTQALR